MILSGTLYSPEKAKYLEKPFEVVLPGGDEKVLGRYTTDKEGAFKIDLETQNFQENFTLIFRINDVQQGIFAYVSQWFNRLHERITAYKVSIFFKEKDTSADLGKMITAVEQARISLTLHFVSTPSKSNELWNE